MLDDGARYERDTTNLGAALEALPGSYDGPSRLLPGPLRFAGLGEGAWPAEVARSWLGEAGSGGTLIVLAGGTGASSAAAVVERAGGPAYLIGETPARGRRAAEADDADDLDLDELAPQHLVPASPLSAYTYLQAVAQAAGRGDESARADTVLASLAAECGRAVPTDANRAKRLAWALWTRTPLLVTAARHPEQAEAWQLHLARIAKSMSVPAGRDPLAVLAGGFEARHEAGDPFVGLLIGGPDDRLDLARELLETRVDEVLAVPAPEAGGLAAVLGLWYLGAWTAYYLALMYDTDPRDTTALERLRDL